MIDVEYYKTTLVEVGKAFAKQFSILKNEIKSEEDVHHSISIVLGQLEIAKYYILKAYDTNIKEIKNEN